MGRRLCAARRPNVVHVGNTVGDGLLLEEGSRSRTADPIHVGIDDPAAPDVDELGVLPTDLDDRQAVAVVRIESHGRSRVRNDLVLHHEPLTELRKGSAKQGSRGVAPGAREAHRHDLAAAPSRVPLRPAPEPPPLDCPRCADTRRRAHLPWSRRARPPWSPSSPDRDPIRPPGQVRADRHLAPGVASRSQGLRERGADARCARASCA